MEKEEIKGNKSAERDVDSRSASEGAREGFFNEAMKELGMPDGKAKPTNDDQGSQSESGKNKSKDQQAPAPNFPRDGANTNPSDQTDPAHKRQMSGEDLKNSSNAKDLHDSIKNSPEHQRENGDRLSKHQIDPSVLKDNGTKLGEMLKNPIDPSVLKDAGKNLDELVKNPIDPSVLKDAGKNLDELMKNPIDPSVLKNAGKNLDELMKNPIDPSLLKDNATKLDELAKNPVDPSVLKDNGANLAEMAKNRNPIDPSLLKEIGQMNVGDLKKDPNDFKNPIDEAKVSDLKGLDKQNIGELLKELSMRNHEYMKPFGKGADGDHILPTGDRIQRENGRETLTTPNGDTVTVNPDGTFRTTGNVAKMTENKDGTHTITYGDGSRVTVGRNGIEKVERGNDRVKFHDMRTALKADASKQINSLAKPRLVAR